MVKKLTYKELEFQVFLLENKVKTLEDLVLPATHLVDAIEELMNYRGYNKCEGD